MELKKIDLFKKVILLFAFILGFSIIGNSLSKICFGDLKEFYNNIFYINKIDRALEIKIPLSLAIQSFCSFILGPLFFLLTYTDHSYIFNAKIQNIFFTFIILSLICGLALLVNINFVNINKSFQLPNIFPDFENKLKLLDTKLELIWKVLTNTKSIKTLFLLIFSLSIIPAIGEEITFRMFLQKQILEITNHFWITNILTSILFSFIHLQIYSLLPRIFFSIILGYIYNTSKNIILPIYMHFFNNTVCILAIYLKNIEKISFDVFKINYVPTFIFLCSIILMLIFIKAFKISYKKNDKLENFN